tara:strand:+ start:11553 stop:12461 length:909 start_codon:yes stop_codon:yes gene_type:complete
MKGHLLVINTHNRLKDFTRLISHVCSYDNLFNSIIIVVDSDKNYYNEIKRILYSFTLGCNKYRLLYLNNEGGANARNIIFKRKYYKNFKYLSFCDDDDIPFKNRFIEAEKFLENNKNCIGFSTSYIRDYGLFTKKIIFKPTNFYFKDIILNNDIGGFSFVTLNTKFCKSSFKIYEKLRSNQDWYLWLSFLKTNPNCFMYKSSILGLVYNDNRNEDRLTLSKSNINSTYLFYLIVSKEMNIKIDSALSYFYYKCLRNYTITNLIKAFIYNRKTLNLNNKHIISLFKNVFFNKLQRLFLSKTSL